MSNEMDYLTSLLYDFIGEKNGFPQDYGFTIFDECLLEGITSRIWQSWCSFCRACVIGSCTGTHNASGVAIQALPQAKSEAHVSSAAIIIRRRHNKDPWSGTNSVFRLEPTWGDVDILVKIISDLGPANSGQLLASFSACSQSAKDLQAIRNALAHNNHQSMQAVDNIRSRYLAFPIQHPAHALFWIEGNSNDFLVTHATDELKALGLAAIS